ncbi:hypothetical protein ACIRQP_41155 [Streptomyces sp. NPDC102274]|uniref:hypothetical protein n=1 Tax=Streptomyces sp. NPDC102274 TaxID=3366151 RepID=UPI0038107E2A
MSVASMPSVSALGGSRWNTFPAAGTTLTARKSFTATEPVVDGTRTALIEVTHGGTTARVDLVQAPCGHRFAHRPDHAACDAPTDDAPRTADLWTTLRTPGLVWTEAGDATLDATGQYDLVVLALLGRLCPENVPL